MRGSRVVPGQSADGEVREIVIPGGWEPPGRAGRVRPRLQVLL